MVIKSILGMFSIFNYIEGESIVPEVQVVDETPGADEPILETQADTLENYRGSKEINPEQLPIKHMNRSMFTSKQDFDEFLQSVKDGGEDIFLPKEADEKIKKGPGRPKKQTQAETTEKETTKKVDDKPVSKEKEDGLLKGKPEGKQGQGPEGADKGKSEADKVEAEKFLVDLGITAEYFLALPEKVQEKLTADDSGSSAIEQRYKKLEAEHTGLINDVVKFKNDPVIAARIEERNTGKAFVAHDLPPITIKEAKELLTLAETPEEFLEAANELVFAKAREVLKIERGVLERNAQRAEREKKAAEVLQKVIEKESRIGITEKDITKISDENHPEYDKLFGSGSLMEMLKRKKYSPAQIIEKGADEILEEYAKTKGWDQERIATIEKKAKQSLLESIRSFKKVARVLDVGKRTTAPISSDESGVFDRQALIAEIASGKTGTWSKLITKYGDQGDNDMVEQLNEIYETGLKQKRV
jgi:hypothetical protein